MTSTPPLSKTEPLLQRAREGDQDAWAALLQRYEMMLLVTVELRMPGFLRRYPGAEDVLQDAWLKVWQSIDSFTYQGAGSFRRWLKRIVVNQLMDTLRERATENAKVQTDTGAQQQLNTSPARSEAPSQILSRIEQKAHLLERIRTLPEEDQDLIIMRIFEEKTWEEIGAVIGCSRDVASKRFAEVITRLGRLVS